MKEIDKLRVYVSLQTFWNIASIIRNAQLRPTIFDIDERVLSRIRTVIIQKYAQPNLP